MASSNIDYRAILYPKGQWPWTEVFGSTEAQANDPNNILYPLIQMRGLVFPYTPTINFGGSATYDEYSFTHTNYSYYAWQKSRPNDIQISAPFTAQTIAESRYLLAVLHFLSSVTKGYYGEKSASLAGSPTAPNGANQVTNQSPTNTTNLTGTPPPVLLFDYLGNSMFKQVPVIVKNYTYTLGPDVDYVSAPVGAPASSNAFGNNDLSNHVPTRLDISITLSVQVNSTNVRKNFSLSNFIKGNFLNTNGGGFV